MRDVLLRTVRTFAQSFIGVVIANGIELGPEDLSTLRMAAVAGIVAALTFVHNLLEHKTDTKVIR